MYCNKMSRLFIIRNIFLKHKWQLLLTYTLFALEMLGLLLRPYFLGEAVNGLLQNSYSGLVYLAASHIGWLAIGTVRHMYDTRTYSAIYTALVTRLLSRRFAQAEVSKLSAHSTLAREFVDFLEYDLNYVIEACYNLLGSLVLLYFYDANVVLLCLGVLVPVMVISYYYGKRMKRYTHLKNNELEQQVSIISSRNTMQINKHYKNLRRWQIKISDMEAWNFGLMEAISVVVLVAALLISVKTGPGQVLMAGSIIGIYNYILKFVTGLDTIPYMVQRITSLRDIMQRIEVGSDEGGDAPPVKQLNSGKEGLAVSA
jgi:ABC-type multidrug transport system fused ATPase/permease subunit